MQTDIDRGRWSEPEVVGQTFEQFASGWLADRADLRPRTVELYQGLLTRHLLPQLGKLRLTAITTAVVRHWYAERLSADVGRSTVAKSYRLLKTILGTAVVDEILSRDPCVLRGAGSERTPERVPPTVAQALTLAEVIEPRWRMLVLMAAFSGLRWGELIALRRSSIDVPRRGDGPGVVVATQFSVNEWFRGDLGKSVALDVRFSGSIDDDGAAPPFEVGTRLLVVATLALVGTTQRFLWGCQFTHYYDPDTAAQWRATR